MNKRVEVVTDSLALRAASPRPTYGRTEIEPCEMCYSEESASRFDYEYCEHCDHYGTMFFTKGDLPLDGNFAYLTRDDTWRADYKDLPHVLAEKKPEIPTVMLCRNCAVVRPDEIFFSVVVVDKAIFCESCETYILPYKRLSPAEFYTAARAAVSQSPNKFIVVDSLGSD